MGNWETPGAKSGFPISLFYKNSKILLLYLSGQILILYIHSRKMRFKVRYSFGSVFLVVLAAVILLGCMAFISYALFPNEAAMREISSVPTKTYVLRYGLGILYVILFFYFTTNYFYYLIAEKKRFIPYLKVSVIIMLGGFAYDTVLFYYLPEALRTKYPSLLVMFFAMIINLLPFFGISLLVAYISNLREGQKQRKILEAQKLQLEVEKSEANLNFLKAQINPHFFFNTLNNLYSLTLKKSDEAPEVVLKLSSLMSYMLYESNAPKVLLDKEIEYLNNYLDVERLRFGSRLCVSFEIEGKTEGIKIPPMILILFVENSFKHGASKMITQPWIKLNLSVENNRLDFSIINSKPSNIESPMTKGNIGLKNVRKRLELLYPGTHELNIVSEPDNYAVHLSLQLHDIKGHAPIKDQIKPQSEYAMA